MVEKETKLGNATLKHICSRTGLSSDLITNLINKFSKEGFGKAEIFRRLTSGFGIPKSHASGSVEGKHKEGHTIFHRHHR